MIDAHVHILPDRVRADPAVAMADPWFAACHASPRAVLGSPEALLAAMDEDGVDKAVCFTWPFADPQLCAQANDWLAATVRHHADRLIGFATVQPADPGAPAETLRCARLGLRGLGELNADAQGWSLDDAAALRGLVSASTEADLPWTLHCSEPVGHAYPGKGTATPDRVARLAEAFPQLRLIAAHLGGGLPFYAHMPEVAAMFRRNVWVDTAAVPFLYADSAWRAVVDVCGADRLLLGTDWPLLRLSRYRDALATLAEPELASVAGGATAALLPG